MTIRAIAALHLLTICAEALLVQLLLGIPVGKPLLGMIACVYMLVQVLHFGAYVGQLERPERTRRTDHKLQMVHVIFLMLLFMAFCAIGVVSPSASNAMHVITVAAGLNTVFFIILMGADESVRRQHAPAAPPQDPQT